MINEHITEQILERIWSANGLGAVHTIQPAVRGMNNLATIINGTHVIRFDALDLDGTCRYLGEQLAYQKIREIGIPAPQVVALDLSKSLVPYHYIILTRIEGAPLIDGWSDFSESQKAEAGRAAGRYLAMMHDISLTGFGELASPGYKDWYGYFARLVAGYMGRLQYEWKVVDSAFSNRIYCLTPCKLLLDSVTTGHLVHSDYQFENLLHRDGVITGIIDFEWAVSGDPGRDFRLDEQWDDDCPGSSAYIYDGYQQLRALEPDHETRVLMYKLQFYMDTVDMYAGYPAEADRFALYYQKMMDVLVALENLFKI